jgi:hypothetical protein
MVLQWYNGNWVDYEEVDNLEDTVENLIVIGKSLGMEKIRLYDKVNEVEIFKLTI